MLVKIRFKYIFKRKFWKFFQKNRKIYLENDCNFLLNNDFYIDKCFIFF